MFVTIAKGNGNGAGNQSVSIRATGAVVGAAVGDALGAPFEFKPRGKYTERFPSPVKGGTGEMIGGGAFNWQPGEFTDDTQMALTLAESLLARGGYDPDDVWLRFRAWGASAADVGNTIRRSLRHADWRSVANDNPAMSAGNGALMRAFPIAVAYLHADFDVVKQVTRHQASLTHLDPAAGWGALVAVEMMRTAILGHDPFDAIERVSQSAPADVWSTFHPLLASDWTPDAGGPSNGSVWGCLAQAVWALRTTSSFEAAVVAAVSLGDDADTVGCVAGALAGARYGIQSIPSRWTTYVHGRLDTPTGEVRYDNASLQDIARSLTGKGPVPAGPWERDVTPAMVAPQLYAADLRSAATTPTGWAVVSLCRTERRFHGYPVRREIFLIDDGNDHNPELGAAVQDAVDAIDAFLAEGRNVVVHCHGGRSRTGLVLKAWKMRADHCAERDAHHWLAERWERYEDYNRSFVGFLESQWPEEPR